jgi:hypothetical protein
MTTHGVRLNDYLFYEFGVDARGHDEARIADDWPFLLHDLGPIEAAGKRWQLFRFADREEDFFAIINGDTAFFPAAGMQADDIALQLEGSHWIGDKDLVGLDTICGTDSDVPSLRERQRSIDALAAAIAGGADLVMLEPLYLRARGEYLALVQRVGEEHAHIVGTHITLRNIPYPQVSPWRRLSLGIGKLVRAGKLC